MRFMGKILFAISILCLSLTLRAEEDPLASEKLVQALRDEVSGEIAFLYTGLISHFDRVQASEGWHESALLIQDELTKLGYKDAAIEGWPSNGSRYYYTYQTPIGWRARKAELWMVSPERERLCSFAEIPLTLVKHSNSANVEAELIDVGTGVGDESYAEKDVKGKIVLATGYTGNVMREAVLKRGALGVVTWYPPDVRPGYPNMIRYTAIWPRWEEKDRIGFGFNVSKNQGWHLRKKLDEGQKVVFKAIVEAEYYDSKIEILTASYPGTDEPEKELLVIGHLCHPSPSANDNASGSGGMLEMARALKQMVDKGLLEPPKRTIRFLWVPEFYGTVPYIRAHLERTRNTLAVINCDMIGEDLHLTGGTFNITCTPDSMPSYLNDVVVNFTKLVERLRLQSMNGSTHPFAYRVEPFSGGSDHYIFNDGALRVPAVMFGHGDTFHHTSLDTTDKVDPSELRRVCFIALGSMYYLANADEAQAKRMARLVTRNGLARFSADYYDSLSRMCDASPAELHTFYKQVMNVIGHASNRETLAVLSTSVFAKNPLYEKEMVPMLENMRTLEFAFRAEAERAYNDICRQKSMAPLPLTLTEEENKLGTILPKREEDFVCPLQETYLIDKLGQDALKNVQLPRYAAYEALNYVDGRRSLLEICRAISAEYGPLEPNKVLSYFRVLERAKLVQLNEQ